MNETIALMRQHVSVREFTGGAVTDDDLGAILDAGRAASTWRSLQSYSIVVIRDTATKQAIADMIGQQPVAQCDAFLVLVGDLSRAATATAMHNAEFHPEGIEAVLVTAVDAALCGQNMLLAAESLGYGGCFIGVIRRFSAQISDLLGLGHHAYPVTGLTLGVPARRNPVKPRMARDAIVFPERYMDDEGARRAAITAYEAALADYPNPRGTTYSETLVDQWGQPSFTSSTDNLKAHGLL